MLVFVVVSQAFAGFVVYSDFQERRWSGGWRIFHVLSDDYVMKVFLEVGIVDFWGVPDLGGFWDDLTVLAVGSFGFLLVFLGFANFDCWRV